MMVISLKNFPASFHLENDEEKNMYKKDSSMWRQSSGLLRGALHPTDANGSAAPQPDINAL
jgi:hypothetical protein